MGRRKLVRILLECSEKPVDACRALNLQQETALDIAKRKHYQEIVDVLQNPDNFSKNSNNNAGGAVPKATTVRGSSGGDVTDRGQQEEARKSRRKSKVGC